MSLTDFCFVFLLIEITRANRNVALDKPAYMSSVGQDSYPALAVDGNINGDHYAILSFDEKPIMNWFVVDLLHQYKIKAVHVYNRKCFGCTSALDHFIVGVTNNFYPGINTTLRGQYSVCGQYRFPALPAGRPMKVECKDNNTLNRFVIIQQDLTRMNNNQLMGFSEVEVYAEEFYGPNYLGCYKTFSEIMEIDFSELRECIDYCSMMNAIFSAVQWGKCKCGNTLSWTIPTEKCYVGCKNSILCGGPYAHAVYMNRKPILPKMFACFNDILKLNTSLVTSQGRFKLYFCLDYCSKDNFNYAKVLNKAECLCGSSMDMKKWKSSNREVSKPCQRTCAKRPDKNCWDPNKVEVHLTCYDDILRSSCQDMYHCKHPFTYNSTGHCLWNQCLPGWKGHLCNMRDCSKNNGNCGIKHICTEMTLGLYIVSECVCGPGFYKRKVQDNCIDIDECITGTHDCKKPIYTCVNKPGSFECVINENMKNIITLRNKALLECRNTSCHQPSQVCTRVYDEYFCHCATGFEYVNISFCQDIDECSQNNKTCLKTASACVNTMGSYMCQCLDGYIEKDKDNCIEASRVAHERNGWNEEVLIVAGAVFAAIFIVITALLARVIYIQKRALRRIQMSLSVITRQESMNTT